MAFRFEHPSIRAIACRWLAALSDPIACRIAPSRPIGTGELPVLIEAAAAHGVLPAVVRNLRAVADAKGAQRVLDHRHADTILSAALAAADDRLTVKTGIGLLLAHHGTRVTTALSAAGVRSAIVKGEVFSRRLYPRRSDRTFTDVDILIPAEDLATSREVLKRLGFRLAASGNRGGEANTEDKWILPENDAVLIEIQTNLIHSPTLGEGIGLSYNDLLAVGLGDPEEAMALLLVAAIHGTAGHQFERLQQVVDILQAARGVAAKLDMSLLKRIARETGSTVALQIALDLAAALFDEPVARSLADQLASTRWRVAWRLLLTPRTVLRAQSISGGRDSWRRRTVREIIKRTGRRERRKSRLVTVTTIL
jgi:hypothetical protein